MDVNMDVLFRDMRIISIGAKLIKGLYLLKTVLTVGIIVFSALELCTAVREKKEAIPQIAQ